MQPTAENLGPLHVESRPRAPRHVDAQPSDEALPDELASALNVRVQRVAALSVRPHMFDDEIVKVWCQKS
jgi:hypothetical protein